MVNSKSRQLIAIDRCALNLVTLMSKLSAAGHVIRCYFSLEA